MTRHQIIETPAGEKLVVVPLADYEALVAAAEDAAEDAADAEAYDAGKSGDGSRALTPLENAAALIRNGLIRAARKRAGLTQAQLAERVGVSQAFVAEVEAGRKRGTDATMSAIAEAIGLSGRQLGVAP